MGDTETESKVKWDTHHACLAVKDMGPHERDLLIRIAEARGQRVSVTELSATLGLPASTALAQDFPALKAYIDKCAAHDLSLDHPVACGGTDADGWYWMSAEISEDAFLHALAH